ncbi:TIGR03086 family metal-binding protein [Streptomyces sp. NPDC057939]|uniref:TIGR03086 family metal-binding protein n=1 Tax=Streptomyces sp. NPDC057939 TaxID=3346284 RepID=UPI0036EE1F0B
MADHRLRTARQRGGRAVPGRMERPAPPVVRPRIGGPAMNGTVTQYLRVLTTTTDTVDRVPMDRWSNPSPCEGWTCLHVLGHIIDGQRQIASLLSGQGPREPRTDPAGAVTGRPATAWADTVQAMRQLLTATTDPNRRVASHHGEVTVDWVLANAVIEPLIHTWDLAQAAGIDVSLDAEAVAATLTAIAPVADRFATTGMYAPALSTSGAATPEQQLLALLGRSAP